MLSVVLELNDTQRAKAIAKGLADKYNLKHIVLDVTDEKLIDPTRVRVTIDGKLKILDCIKVENEYDLEKQSKFYFDEDGRVTKVKTKLVDFILDKEKKSFDEECFRELYRLQDEALKEVMDDVEKAKFWKREVKEHEKKVEEAKKILANTLKIYEDTINELKAKVRELESENSNLNRIIIDYASFIESKQLTEEFIEAIMKKRMDMEKSRIREEYLLRGEEEDC
jgi:phenylalanyl-tRNA synthetase alpha subunit